MGIFFIYPLIAMQLLDIIAYGPDTFGAYRKSGGDSENVDKNVFGHFYTGEPDRRKQRKQRNKQAEAENNELKTNTELHPVVFA
jgi:hypothetical protein